MRRFRSKVALNNGTSVNTLAVHLEDDSITDILQSRKIRSILGVEADSDGYITPLSDNNSSKSRSRPRTRFGRTQSLTSNLSSRSKSETLGRSRHGRNRTPKRVRSLVNWFEKLAAKHQEPETSETPVVKGLEWKPALHDIMDDVELLGALESFMSRLYCEENLLYLKELRELGYRFGGGLPVGHAHLSPQSSPVFGERPSISPPLLKPSKDHRKSTSASRFADDEEMTVASRDEEDVEADDEKSEERTIAMSDEEQPDEVIRSVSLIQSETGDADIEDEDEDDEDDIDVVEQSFERSVDYQMSGMFESSPPPRQRESMTLDDTKDREETPDATAERQSSIRIHSENLPFQETAVMACKRLWRDYISSNAYHQVNLSFDTREGIRSNIRALSRMSSANCLPEKDSTIIDIFVDSQKEIEKLIRTDTLSKFYDSPEFIVIAKSRPADE